MFKIKSYINFILTIILRYNNKNELAKVYTFKHVLVYINIQIYSNI